MLSGFMRAVGPVQPGEQPDATMYDCQVGIEANERGACVFALYDAGTGKTVVHCATHNYRFLAIDWTAAHFAGSASLEEDLTEIRRLFSVISQRGVTGIDETVPNVQQQRFAEVFLAIIRNLQRIASE